MLPSYENFKQLKKDRFIAEEKAVNKHHHDYADAWYVYIERCLAKGYDEYTVSEVPGQPYSSNYWLLLLQEKCLKEGWVLKNISQYFIHDLEIKHKKDHNWLTRLLKGWN